MVMVEVIHAYYQILFTIRTSGTCSSMFSMETKGKYIHFLLSRTRDCSINHGILDQKVRTEWNRKL